MTSNGMNNNSIHTINPHTRLAPAPHYNMNGDVIKSATDNAHFNSVHNSRCVSRKCIISNNMNKPNSNEYDPNMYVTDTEENMIQKAIEISLIEENMIQQAINVSLCEYNIQNQSKINIQNLSLIETAPDNNTNNDIDTCDDTIIKTITTKCNNDESSLDRYVRLIVDDVVNINNSQQTDILSAHIITPINLQDQSCLDIGEPMDIDDQYQISDKLVSRRFKTDSLNFTDMEEEHYDFIVGRGRTDLEGYMNIPINPVFSSRNVVFIDANPKMNADIKQFIETIDFSWFGICKDQDPEERIIVNIIFDWSSFYCGAMQNLTNIVTNIGRRCRIFIPLDSNNNDVPSDIMRELKNSIFTITVENGHYPLFDWTKEGNVCLGINPMSGRPKIIRELVNPDKYILIYAF